MTKIKDKKYLAKGRAILTQKHELEKLFDVMVRSYFAKCKQAIASGKNIPSSEILIRQNADRIVSALFSEHENRKGIRELVLKGNELLIGIHYKSINITNKDKYDWAMKTAREMHNEPEIKAASTK